MAEEDAEQTIFENEARAADSSGGIGSGGLLNRATKSIRKTLGGIIRKKSILDLPDESSALTTTGGGGRALAPTKSSFKFGGTAASSSKEAVEQACLQIKTGALETTKEKCDALKVLRFTKPKDRAYLLSLLVQHDLFAGTFVTLQADSEVADMLADVVHSIAAHDEETCRGLYVALKQPGAQAFYEKMIALAGEDDEAALSTLICFANSSAVRTEIINDLKDVWETVVHGWLRHPANTQQQESALQFLLALAQEEGNRVKLYAELKPVIKNIMDLATQYKPGAATGGDENTAKLALLLLSNLAAHRYNASLMGVALKPLWKSLQDFIVNKDTGKDVTSAAIQLMWNLSFVRDNNQVFSYSDVKPLLSSLMELCRNAKTPQATTTLAVFGLWNNLALVHENRVAIHSDLKSMWALFSQFLTKSNTPDALTLMTLSLLNNLAFASENQAEMYVLIKPSWNALLNHVRAPRTPEIQSMCLLFLRNLAAANENKTQIFKDIMPIWGTIMDALKSPQASGELDYAACHLLWYLSKSESNRGDLYSALLPMLSVIIRLIKERKDKENVYALLATLKNLAQAVDNRKNMCLDLKPYFPALFARFDLEAAAENLDELELTIWLLQNLALERENQEALYTELKPIWPKLCGLLRQDASKGITEQILLLWSSLAVGKRHAAWVYIDLEPVRSKLGDLIEAKDDDVLEAVLLLFSNMAVEEQTAVWIYKDLGNARVRAVVQHAETHERTAVREYALRFLGSFAIRALREDICENHASDMIPLFERDATNLDSVLALAVLCGDEDVSRVEHWFADDSLILLVLKVLEDCTVTGEWGYEMERPLEALSYLVGVDAMRKRVKVNMLLDAVETSWKKRDYTALQFAFSTLKCCVGDENNEMRFQGNVALMEIARKLSQQDDQKGAREEAKAFLSKFADGALYA